MGIRRAVPVLQLKRSGQSGSKTLTDAYAAAFEDSNSIPWIFAGASIDLTSMEADDTVHIRVSIMAKSGGAYLVEDESPYTGVQPADAKAIRIGAFPNIYGVKIEAYQSAGAPPYLSLDMDFFVAKR